MAEKYVKHEKSINFTGMNINGSPESLNIFGFKSPDQDLFASTYTSPINKRSCLRAPNMSKVSPLTATLNKSLNGIYSSQEVSNDELQFKCYYYFFLTN